MGLLLLSNSTSGGLRGHWTLHSACFDSPLCLESLSFLWFLEFLVGWLFFYYGGVGWGLFLWEFCIFFLVLFPFAKKKSEHCFSSFSSISVSPLSFRHSLSNSLYRIDHLSLHNTPTDTIIHISCVFCFLQNFSLIESGQVNDLSSGADSIFFFLSFETVHFWLGFLPRSL